jgi:hypothetical protein
MKKLFCSAVACLFGSAAFAQVVNGGFETGNFNGWTTQAAPFGSDFGVAANGVHTHSGTYSAFFGSFDSYPDQIFQDVTVTSGAEYILGFWLDNEAQSGQEQMIAAWESGVIFRDSAPVGWTQFSFLVTAHSSTAQVYFGGFDTSDLSYLDDVTLTAVPEPASLAALALGAIALLRRRRRI